MRRSLGKFVLSATWGWFALALAPIVSQNASAYQTSLHFYTTYLTAYQCGLSEDAYTLAWADYSVDRYPGTNAGTSVTQWLDLRKVEDRRLFHFPITSSAVGVVRASDQASYLIDEALRGAKGFEQSNPILFGIGLHVYQDSWAHEGYGNRFGHAWTVRPDYPQYDPDRAMEMIQATWRLMNEWSMRTRGKICDRPFTELYGLLGVWLKIPQKSPTTLARTWKELVRSVTGQTVTPFDRDKEPVWERKFLTQTADVKKHHGDYGYRAQGGEMFDLEMDRNKMDLFTKDALAEHQTEGTPDRAQPEEAECP